MNDIALFAIKFVALGFAGRAIDGLAVALATLMRAALFLVSLVNGLYSGH